MRTVAAVFPAVLAGVLLAAACGSGTSGESATLPEESTASAARARLDDHRFLGDPLALGNLTVWPIHTDEPLDVGEFLTLQEAQEDGIAAVREIGGAGAQQRGAINRSIANVRTNGQVVADGGAQVDGGAQEVELSNVTNGSGGAQVNTLVIENKGDRPLLVCAGTVVKGGNQDRQIGQDIVIAAGETVPVDAFCVEAGRWTAQREGVATAGEFVALDVVAHKDVRTKGQYMNDQSGVWEAVAIVRTRVSEPVVASAAGGARAEDVAVQIAQAAQIGNGTTFVDALEKVSEGRKQAREESISAVREFFAQLSQDASAPIGFAYAVNGKPQSVRVFAHNRLLEKNLAPFVNAMVLEAETAATDTDAEPCDAQDVVAMVRAIEKDAEESREQTRASNVNVLFRNDVGFNGNCYVEAEDGKEIPVTQDWTRR